MRIDVHFHAFPPEYRAAALASGATPLVGKFPVWSVDLALNMMDANGIQTGIMSVTYPGVSFCKSAVEARTIARKFNEYAAELIAKRSDRFGGFALLPIQNVEHGISNDLQDTAAEIEYSLDRLKLDGVQLFTCYGGKYLGDPVFEPILEMLNRRRAVVHVHPTLNPLMKQLDIMVPGYVLEYVFDTTRAAASLMFSGALDRFPQIRFILSHAGGTLPFLSWRVANTVAPDGPLPQWEPEEILRKLRRFWYDTALSPGPQAMKSLFEVADPAQIVFGSDWPLANDKKVAREIAALSAPGFLSNEQRAAIDRGNALPLFPRLM
jgi:predicted TIM-barrel fold metal-dependent hydrolase